MPSHLAGRIAVVLGVAAILLFVVMTFVPPTAQVLVAVLSLPVVGMLVSATGSTQRRRVR